MVGVLALRMLVSRRRASEAMGANAWGVVGAVMGRPSTGAGVVDTTFVVAFFAVAGFAVTFLARGAGRGDEAAVGCLALSRFDVRVLSSAMAFCRFVCCYVRSLLSLVKSEACMLVKSEIVESTSVEVEVMQRRKARLGEAAGVTSQLHVTCRMTQ